MDDPIEITRSHALRILQKIMEGLPDEVIEEVLSDYKLKTYKIIHKPKIDGINRNIR